MTRHTARIRSKLSYSLLCSAIMCLRGAEISIHHPATSPHGSSLPRERVPLQWTEPTYIQPPCTYSTPFVSQFDWLNEMSSIKKNSAVVKINFRGGKNQFPSLVSHANFHAGNACLGNALIWLVGIRGKTLPVRGKLRTST